MSELRKEIEEGRREHREVRYPGDLGADVLGVRSMRLGYATKPRRHWMFWANVGALGAVAATVAVVMFRVQPAVIVKNVDGYQPTVAVAIQPRGEDEFSVVPELAGATLVPQGSLVPQGESIVPSMETAVTVPAMPSFPSMSDVIDSATSTNTNEENT
jgi:hypothetical protein